MIGDRRKVAYEQNWNRIIVNLVCHRVDDEEGLYEEVARQLEWELEKFPLTHAVNLAGPFDHEQPGNEEILFFEATLASPNGQCFEAKEHLHYCREWWN